MLRYGSVIEEQNGEDTRGCRTVTAQNIHQLVAQEIQVTLHRQRCILGTILALLETRSKRPFHLIITVVEVVHHNYPDHHHYHLLHLNSLLDLRHNNQLVYRLEAPILLLRKLSNHSATFCIWLFSCNLYTVYHVYHVNNSFYVNIYAIRVTSL